MISYISIYTSDVIKGLELYNKCLKINPRKPPLYGKDLEILIPWVDWNNYAMKLFPTLEELESVDLYEYFWETDMKLKILPDDIIKKLYLIEIGSRLGVFSSLSYLVSESFETNVIKFLSISIFDNFGFLEYHLDSQQIPIMLDMESEIKYNLINREVLYRRFINSDPKRFESLNNVIKKYKNYE